MPLNKETKPSDGNAPILGKHSLLLLPDLFSPALVALDRVLSLGQIELLDI